MTGPGCVVPGGTTTVTNPGQRLHGRLRFDVARHRPLTTEEIATRNTGTRAPTAPNRS